MDYFTGYSSLKYLGLLRKTEFDSTRLKRFQRGMLKSLLENAYDNAPYYHDLYRKLGLNPRCADPDVVFSRTPILTKQTLRAEQNRLVSPYPSKFRVVTTSGSSGIPLVVLKDDLCEGLGLASYYEGLMWYGYAPGDALCKLWGRRPVQTTTSRKYLFIQRLMNNHPLNAHYMSDSVMDADLEKIVKVRPKVLYSYVSSLELLCRHMRERGLRYYIPVVVTTAEKLFGFQRNLIGSTIAREVYDQYGASEVTSVAFECPSHSSLHVMPKSIVEIVDDDGEEVGPGETGRIILTDLTNFKMPLVRYEVGDAATRSDSDVCGCGRVLSSVKNIEGRIGDIILGLNGNRVHGEFFSHVFEDGNFGEIFGLRQFQVVQKSRHLIKIRLNIEKTPRDQDLARLNSIIRMYLGPVEIVYEFLSDIPIHSSGKRRSFISEIQSVS